MSGPATTAFVSSAPVLGEGGLGYAAGTDGQLTVWHRGTFAPAWAAPIPNASGGVVASPNLDCNRLHPAPGRPGVLYVAALDGTLTAILVDSPRLDATADWPKYQRDAANTGNATLPAARVTFNPGCP